MKPRLIAPMLVLIAFVLSACGIVTFFDDEPLPPPVESAQQAPPPVVQSNGQEISMTGTVIGSVDECAFDGTCALLIQSDSGIFQVNWAEGMMGCLGEFTGDVAVGYTVSFYALTVEPSVLSICSDESYYIRSQDLAEGPPIGQEEPPVAQPGNPELTLTGTVTGTIDDCAFDGICALIVETDSGTYQVNWAEGMMGCFGEFTGEVAAGDSVEVFALTLEPGTLSICSDEGYYIRKA